MRHECDITRVVTSSITSTLHSAPPESLTLPSISSCSVNAVDCGRVWTASQFLALGRTEPEKASDAIP